MAKSDVKKFAAEDMQERTEKRNWWLEVVKSHEPYAAVKEARDLCHYHLPSSTPDIPTTPRWAMDKSKREWESIVRTWKLDVRAFSEWWQTHRMNIL